MDFEKARIIMQQPGDDRVFRLIRAAATICSPENADKVPIKELLQCLKRGNERREYKLVAEYAAMALYRRTNRYRKPEALPYEDFITDADDWLSYLKQHQFIA